MNRRNNARAQNTRKAIESAALGLLEAQPAQRLTVQAICRAAQINRSTFYRHFPDLPALAESLWAEHQAQMRALISGGPELSPQNFRQTLVQLIRYTQMHRGFFLAYFNINAFKFTFYVTSYSFTAYIYKWGKVCKAYALSAIL